MHHVTDVLGPYLKVVLSIIFPLPEIWMGEDQSFIFTEFGYV
jgi:hypothetical protein